MDRGARLAEIELELDKTDNWENPPYRNCRRQLNSERARLIRQKEGRDHNWFAKGTKGETFLKEKRKKQAVLNILNELEE